MTTMRERRRGFFCWLGFHRWRLAHGGALQCEKCGRVGKQTPLGRIDETTPAPKKGKKRAR